MSIKKNLGKKIRDIRLSRNLTQEALAEKINLSAKSLSQIEIGNNFVSADTLSKLCEVLNINPKVLFDFDLNTKNNLSALNEINARLKKNPKLLEMIYKIVIALDY